MKNLFHRYGLILLVVSLANVALSQRRTFLNKDWESSSGNVSAAYQRSASVVDGSDNLYVTSNTFNSNGDTDVSIIKYDSEGTLQWQQTYAGSGNADDYGIDIILDGSNIYVAAALTVGTNDTDFGVLKYNSSGTLQWASTWGGTANGYDVPADLIADASGNIYIVGGSEASNDSSDYSIVKYNSSGTQQWQTGYDYTNLHDAATGITFQSSTPVVTGASASSSTNWDYATLSLNPNTGAITNTNRTSVTGAGLDQALALTTDDNDNVYITGYAEVNGDKRIRTLKFDDTFTLDWTADLDGTYDDIGTSIDVDGSGNVYVCGSTELSNGDLNFVTVKYNSSGTQQWKKEFGDASEIVTYGADHIVVVNSEKIMVVGTIENDEEVDFMAICYDETGGLIFTEEYDNYGANDEINSITVDGDVFYLTGTSDNGTTRTTTVVKFDTWINEQPSVMKDGEPWAVDDEVLIYFNPDHLDKTITDNLDLTWGYVEDFLADSACTAIEAKLDFDINRLKCYKMFPRSTSLDTLAYGHSGKKVELEPFYASFGVVIPEESEDSTVMDSLNLAYPYIVVATLNPYGYPLAGANDPLYTNGSSAGLNGSTQYPNAHINIEPAWDYADGSDSVIVGVYDTGINYSHSDFSNGTYATSTVNDGWDYINSVHPSTFAYPDNIGHGTAVAGIIGAWRNNNSGMAGIAGGDDLNTPGNDNGALIHDMKIFDTLTGIDCQPAALTSVSAIGTAIHDGMGLTNLLPMQDVMNHSWAHTGGPNFFIRREFRTAYDLDITMNVASGNYGAQPNVLCMHVNFPGSFPDHYVVKVGANDTTGARADFSFCGWDLDFIAPGVHQLYENPDKYSNTFVDSTTHDTCVGPIDGTSFAAPHASGVAALMVDYNKNAIQPQTGDNFAPEDIEELISRFATDLTTTPNQPGYDNETGWGRINAGRVFDSIRYPKFLVHHVEDTFSLANYTGTSTNHWTCLEQGVGGQPVGPTKVRRYSYYFSATHTLPQGYDLIAGWSRGSDSQNILDLQSDLTPNCAPNYFFGQGTLPAPPYPLMVQGTLTSTGVNFQGYIYEILDPFGNHSGWYPTDTSGEAIIAYTLYLKDPLLEIEEEEVRSTFKIFPNPTDNQFSLIIDKSIGQTVDIYLFDLTGRMVQILGQQLNPAEDGDFTYSVDNLQPGIYFVTLYNGIQPFTKKLIIE